MARVRLPFIASFMIVIVAACSRHDPVAADAEPVNFPVLANAPHRDPMGGPPENATAPVESTPAVTAQSARVAIPGRLQGRWGLTPADCTASRSNARGLLVVGPKSITFFESRAVPAADAETDNGSVDGRFQFSGEGKSWTKFETLRRTGDTLTRTETNPAASYTYAKC